MNDKAFLMWLYNRLHYVHGENENVDYMLKLGSIISAMDEAILTPPNIGGYKCPPLDNEGEIMEKTLGNSDVLQAKVNVPDIKVFGDGDMFRLLCKASSQKEGWMKSTKAMEVVGGCVVQVTTHQRNHDGTNAVAEALTYVPGVCIADDENNGRKLVPINFNL